MSGHDFDVAFRQLSGSVTALEFAVKILIITHPERKKLAHIWRTMLPEQIDRFMEHPAYAVTEQRDAIHKMLADLGAFIEMELPGEDPEGES